VRMDVGFGRNSLPKKSFQVGGWEAGIKQSGVSIKSATVAKKKRK
jgi:hypothetical protein